MFDDLDLHVAEVLDDLDLPIEPALIRLPLGGCLAAGLPNCSARDKAVSAPLGCQDVRVARPKVRAKSASLVLVCIMTPGDDPPSIRSVHLRCKDLPVAYRADNRRYVHSAEVGPLPDQ